MPMEIINATRLVAPAPDSQYRLLPCECGNDQPVYVVGCDGKWRVLCLDCKKETEGFGIQHDAQIAWNKVCRDRREKPCMGCPDRYPGCSDHCQKPGFLAFKAKQAQIREAERKEKALWGYTANEIRKNRRVR